MQTLTYARARRKKRPVQKAVLLLLLLILLPYALWLRPAVQISNRHQIDTAAAVMVRQAVEESIRLDGESFFRMEQDETGEVLAVQLNEGRCTAFQLAFEKRLTTLLQSGFEYRYTVPLGALLGSDLFMTSGPDVPLGVMLFGTVKTAFGTDMESVGINQTRYRLKMTVVCRLRTSLRESAPVVKVSGSYTVAELMVCGEIPQVNLSLPDG